MWVEWLAGEWIATSSPMFATEWPGFHKFSRGPSLMTFFSGSPASGWVRNFRLDYIELPQVCIIIVIMNIKIINNDFMNYKFYNIIIYYYFYISRNITSFLSQLWSPPTTHVFRFCSQIVINCSSRILLSYIIFGQVFCARSHIRNI